MSLVKLEKLSNTTIYNFLQFQTKTTSIQARKNPGMGGIDMDFPGTSWTIKDWGISTS